MKLSFSTLPPGTLANCAESERLASSMDVEKITSDLVCAFGRGTQSHPSAWSRSENPDFEAHFRPRVTLSDREAVKRIQGTLEAQADLSILKPAGWFFYPGGGGFRIDIPNIVAWLISEASIHDAAQVVTAFAEFIKRNEVIGFYACAAAGLSVDSPVEFGNGVSIVPFESLPPSYGRGYVREQFINPAGIPLLPPLAVLTIPFRQSPAIVQMEGGEAPKNTTLSETAAESQTLFLDTLRCLSLVGPRHVAPLGYWNQIATPGAPNFGASVSNFATPSFWVRVRPPLPLDLVDARQLVDAFFQLSPKFRAELRISSDRLNNALGESNPVDKAIDLGIALEALLLHGLGANRGELRFRLALYGAALIGGSPSEKMANFKLLRKLYDLRSGAVHSGSLQTSGDPQKILTEGSTMCSTLIRKLIDLKAWPDWETLVFGKT